MDPLYLVRLAGIEPTTPWFVAKYSIQLSYSREKRNYSTSITKNGREAAKNFSNRRPPSLSGIFIALYRSSCPAFRCIYLMIAS